MKENVVQFLLNLYLAKIDAYKQMKIYRLMPLYLVADYTSIIDLILTDLRDREFPSSTISLIAFG